MPRIPAPEDQWYVVHCLSGQENKVRQRIERAIEAEELGDIIFKVLMPQETVSEVRRGEKTEAKKKFYPGYIIINMHLFTEDNELVERAWSFMSQLDGAIGFAGSKDIPLPMRPRDVEAMLSQIEEREDGARPSISFEVGDEINRRDRRGKRQITCFRYYFRSGDSSGARILAGRTSITYTIFQYRAPHFSLQPVYR